MVPILATELKNFETIVSAIELKHYANRKRTRRQGVRPTERKQISATKKNIETYTETLYSLSKSLKETDTKISHLTETLGVLTQQMFPNPEIFWSSNIHKDVREKFHSVYNVLDLEYRNKSELQSAHAQTAAKLALEQTHLKFMQDPVSMESSLPEPKVRRKSGFSGQDHPAF